MDYSVIDNSHLPQYLFHPRRDYTEPPEGSTDLTVEVEKGTWVHCRLYAGEDYALGCFIFTATVKWFRTTILSPHTTLNRG